MPFAPCTSHTVGPPCNKEKEKSWYPDDQVAKNMEEPKSNLSLEQKGVEFRDHDILKSPPLPQRHSDLGALDVGEVFYTNIRHQTDWVMLDA